MIRLYLNSNNIYPISRLKKAPSHKRLLPFFSAINTISADDSHRSDERAIITVTGGVATCTDHRLDNLVRKYGLLPYRTASTIYSSRGGDARAFSTSTSSSNPPTSDGSSFSGNSLESLEDTLANIQSLAPSSSATTTAPDTAAAVVESFDSFARSGWISDYMIDTLLFIAKNTDLGLAGSILSFTVGFRLLVFPLFLKTQRNSSRMAHMKPELDLMKQRLEKDPNKDIETVNRYQKQMQALFAKYGCHPLVGLALPLAQMPVFMSMFFALQRLPELYPQTLSTEGILWFPNLAVADPYYILPLLTAGSFALTIEISKNSMKASAADPAQARIMITAMRVLSAIMIPFTATFPAVMFVYWLPNNIVSFLSALLLQQSSIRKKIGIWDPPKPPPGSSVQSKDILKQIQEAFGRQQTEMERQQQQQLTFTHRPPISKNQTTATSTTEMAKSARQNQQLRLEKIRRGTSKQVKKK